MVRQIPKTCDVPKAPREGLPRHAVCVFKGVMFEVWQWEQELFDKSSAVFEKIWRQPSIAVIATVGDKIIIEHQLQPGREEIRTLPCGRVEEGEEMLEAAKRELAEETGYMSTDWVLYKKCLSSEKILYTLEYFIARDCVKSTEPQIDPGEHITVELIAFNDYLDHYMRLESVYISEFSIAMHEIAIDANKRKEFKKLIFEKE